MQMILRYARPVSYLLIIAMTLLSLPHHQARAAMVGKGAVMLRSIVFGLVVALIGLQADPATAEQVCGERTKLMTHLGKNYAEAPVAIGLTSAGAVIEVLTSASGTWTFLVTYPSGQTCMVASGKSWETLPIETAGQVS